jgi:hypothetical protein
MGSVQNGGNWYVHTAAAHAPFRAPTLARGADSSAHGCRVCTCSGGACGQGAECAATCKNSALGTEFLSAGLLKVLLGSWGQRTNKRLSSPSQ